MSTFARSRAAAASGATRVIHISRHSALARPRGRARARAVPIRRPPSSAAHRRRWPTACSAGPPGAALLTLALLVGILLSLVIGAWPAIHEVRPGLPHQHAWDPVQEEFGGLVMIYGTLATSFIALVIAVPVSFGIALFLTELSPAWLKRPLGTAIELLAAVPSHRLRHVGPAGVRPDPRRPMCSSRCRTLFAGVPYLGALVSGPAGGHRHPVGRHHPGDHDHSRSSPR